MASSPASQVYIARDDGDGISLGGGNWHVDERVDCFGGAFLFPSFSQTPGHPASFNFSFDGTEFRIFGFTAPATSSQIFQVSIDGQPLYQTSTDDNSPKHLRQWYQSPVLVDGQHTVQVEQINGMGLDFITVAPGPNTPLTGETLIVDDTYDAIQYSNGWQLNPDSTFVNSSIWTGSNFMNTTHSTRTAGDTLQFSYTGTNASVFGNMLWEQVGSFILTYSLDGGTNSSQTFSSDGTNSIKEQPNFKLIDTGPLSPGNHTLQITLDSCIEQTLVIDYITYSPSFDTLASMPNLRPSSSATSTITSSTGAASSTDGPVPAPSKTNVGAIVGGVIGGFALLALIAAFVLWYRQRRKEMHQYQQQWQPLQYISPQNSPNVQNQSQNQTSRIEPLSQSGGSNTGQSPPASAMRVKPDSVPSYNPSQSSYSSSDPSTRDTTAASTTIPTTIPASPRRLEAVNRGNTNGKVVERLQEQVYQIAAELQQLRSFRDSPPAYTGQ